MAKMNLSTRIPDCNKIINPTFPLDKDKNHENRFVLCISVLMLVLTFVVLTLKVFVGLDQDEQAIYCIMERFLDGELWIFDLYDPRQFPALIMVPLWVLSKLIIPTSPIVCFRIISIEYTEEALNIARVMNPQVIYIQGDIREIPFPDQYFDVILCTEVLEHVENPDIAIKELVRVAKRFVLISVPHEPWFCMGNLMVLKNVTRLGNPIDHINHWTKNGLKKFLDVDWSISTCFPWCIAEYRKQNE